jgi:hypothetical protein
MKGNGFAFCNAYSWSQDIGDAGDGTKRLLWSWWIYCDFYIILEMVKKLISKTSKNLRLIKDVLSFFKK